MAVAGLELNRWPLLCRAKTQGAVWKKSRGLDGDQCRPTCLKKHDMLKAEALEVSPQGFQPSFPVTLPSGQTPDQGPGANLSEDKSRSQAKREIALRLLRFNRQMRVEDAPGEYPPLRKAADRDTPSHPPGAASPRTLSPRPVEQLPTSEGLAFNWAPYFYEPHNRIPKGTDRDT